jgi:ZIP family zinc transporter
MLLLAFLGLATCASTFLGGLFALRLKDQLHLVLGFSAGAVVAVAFLDLLPEALDIGKNYTPFSILTVTAIGFLVYLAIDRMVLLHGHNHDDTEHAEESKRGYFGAATLSVHSFLDGLGIGLAFQASPFVGFIVAAGVLSHDFSDGINTVNIVLKNNGDRRLAFRWLISDALAPLAGIAATLFFSMPAPYLALLLALFAGFFFYIGASDLIPESHHSHPVRWTTFSTILGVVVMYLIIHLAGA